MQNNYFSDYSSYEHHFDSSKTTDNSSKQTFKGFESFHTSDKMLSETVNTEVCVSDEPAKEKFSMENKNGQFQATETLCFDNTDGIYLEKIDGCSQPSCYVQDDFSLKSPNAIYSEEFMMDTRNISNGEEFDQDKYPSEEMSVGKYFSNFLNNCHASRSDLGRNIMQSDNYDVHTSTEPLPNENVLFGNKNINSDASLRNSDFIYSEDHFVDFNSENKKLKTLSKPKLTSEICETSVINSSRKNLNKNNFDLKDLVEVVHYNVDDEFLKVGVKCTFHKVTKGSLRTVFQKFISPIDVQSEKFYEILFSHLILILNDGYLKGLLEKYFFS